MKPNSSASPRDKLSRDSRVPGAGYSGKPLREKLGIKPKFRVAVIAAPPDFKRALGALPAGATLTNRLTAAIPMIVAFAANAALLKRGFARWKNALARDGSLWICWPKRSSSIATDIDENIVRACALSGGLVDVKVCAIDATWSGLKCVYRLADRQT